MESGYILSCLSCDPWNTVPAERDPHYFRAWQRTSVALQKALRQWIPELYFRGTSRFEDRHTAYQVIVYAACRPCYGQPRTEFTFDMADPAALTAALRSIGHLTRLALAPIEQRLRADGRPDLARRYMPVWHQDIIREVKKQPKLLIRLLASEAKIVDAVIDLGTSRDIASVRAFLRIAQAVLRTLLGDDMRELIPLIIELAARTLAEQNRPAGCVGDLSDGGILNDDDTRTARRPDSGIAGEKDSDNRRPNRCGEMSNAGVIPDVKARGSEPAAEPVQIVESNRLVQYFLEAGGPTDGPVKS